MILKIGTVKEVGDETVYEIAEIETVRKITDRGSQKDSR